MAVIAEELGASSVPASTDEVRSYLASVRRDLAPSDAAVDTVRFLRGLGQDALERTAVRILMNAAVRVLPVWAPPQLNLNHPGPVLDLLHRAAAHALGAVLRFGCEPSPILETARARANTPHAGGCVDHAAHPGPVLPRSAPVGEVAGTVVRASLDTGPRVVRGVGIGGVIRGGLGRPAPRVAVRGWAVERSRPFAGPYGSRRE
ncbi:oxygenase MpaB family protein [Streptomyces sp. NBC_00162]|uniref:oxygenase MpaB family protein n=1 Tax=Streptomyces sp. NBC_00162 TaxID=2903629 RepID=UPI00214B1568|nr:oxygenase MpaB family protein [Streptomyces sp. NBC_00162]UUU44023.1 hypothetical protein JIW86_37600 [Streptomyces sp. NBC_00162]